MRKMKKLVALFMTALMLICMFGMTVCASSYTEEDNPEITELQVEKDLVMDDDVENYPNMTFTFNFEQLTTQQEVVALLEDNGETRSNIDDDWSSYIGTTSAPLADLTINFNGTGTDTEKDATVTDPDGEGLKTVTKYAALKGQDETGAAINLTGDHFSEPGLYVYQVTEEALALLDYDGTTDLNRKLTKYDELTCSTAKYLLVIPVEYNDNATTINKLDINLDDAIILKAAADHAITKDTITVDNVKVSVPKFTNVYQRNEDPETPDNPADYGLEITKTVKGEFADRTQEFHFKIQITKNATESDTAEYSGSVYEKDGITIAKDENGVEKVYSTEFEGAETYTLQFTLKDGQTMRFTKFPVGTTYKIREYFVDAEGNEIPGTDGYTVKATVYDKSLEHEKEKTGAELANGTYKVGETDNKVAVSNEKGSTPLTGIVTDNLSFILLIVVAVAGMTAYVVLKRRLRNR